MKKKRPDNIREIERKLRELSCLAEINRKIHSTIKMDRLLGILVKQAVIGVNFERGLIYLLEDNFLRCVAFLDRVKKEKGSTIKDLKGFRMDENAVEVMAVKTGTPFHIKNAETDKRVSQKLLKVMDSREYCVVPLIGRSGTLGVLTGDKAYSNDPILADEIKTLEVFAGHISLAIENAFLFEEKERFTAILEEKIAERTRELAEANERLKIKMKELSTLFEISGNLNRSLGVSEVASLVLSLVKDLGHSMCALHLYGGRNLEKIFQRGLGNKYPNAGPPPFKKDIKDQIGKSDSALIINDMPDKLKTSDYQAYITGKNIRSGLIIPLKSGEELAGILIIFSKKANFFEEEHERFFSAFGLQLSMALEKALAFQDIKDQKDRMEKLSKKLEQENVLLREKMKTEQERKFIIGSSPAMNEVMDLVHKVAPTNTSVIIYGETGTGKELIANAIHETGPRRLKPLIKVNCAAIPEELLESELFGHEKGAFTGAHERRVGMFQLAQGGSIFLDEIGDISLKTQTKLLRSLQDSEIQPLGSKASYKVDVRVIAATNKDLKKKIEEGTFRTDLFYRLNVFPITMPALRDRLEDIPRLVEFFMEKYSHLKKGNTGIDKDVIEVFLRYPWPGNIRELENIIERLMIISGPGNISTRDLPRELSMDIQKTSAIRPLNEALFDLKKEMVKQALAENHGKKADAAQMLGMARSNFSRLLRQLGIN